MDLAAEMARRHILLMKILRARIVQTLVQDVLMKKDARAGLGDVSFSPCIP